MGVSRQHALLRPTLSQLLVHDLGSANGTYLNARMLIANTTAEVCDGDILSFGTLHLKVSIIKRP
jgi:pSer/pThr/pTyr-binding forkhead associated (FHA) protein